MRHSKIIHLTFALCFLVVAGCTTAKNVPPPAANSVLLTPGPNDGRIAYVTARLMEEFHYSQQPLDAEMSKKFFDGYFETLDPRHENFLQSDIDEFAHWRTNLDTLTIGNPGNAGLTPGKADLTPAYEIFQRFTERLQQHVAYADDLLKQDKFKFNTDEQFLIDRRHAPYPQNLDEAKELWRQRLRYEYLQEKLGREMQPSPMATFTNTVEVPSTVQTKNLSKTNLAEITDTLARRYHRGLHAFTNWDNTDVLQAYLNALTHAYDPHSDYLNNVHAQQFSIEMNLSLFGIGAQLSSADGYCTIISLLPGGPAAKSKLLKEKDRIVAVAQGSQPFVDVVDMELDKVVQLIRGPKGTQVRLTIAPADDLSARRVVTLIRDEIKLEDAAAKAKLIEMPDGRGETNRIGLIDLPSFYRTIDLPGNFGHSTAKSTTDDVTKLIKKLKQEKVSGIIIDLRTNPGGSLEEAVKFTGLFIKDGPIVLARSSDSPIAVDSDTDSSMLYDGPLVVLINRFSASAAEIAAAALQDYGRALVVGDTSTHGKGTVQNLNPLRPFVWPAVSTATNDPGTVKITIRKFYRVSGASTQLKGVASDIVLPDILNYSTEIGETSLENPLPWDTIPSVTYDKLNLVAPYLSTLRRLSDARTATNQDFIYIRQDIEQFKKLQADKTATLNEREELKKHEDHQSLLDARAKERSAQKTPAEKIYELTVENAGQPGLPPPETNSMEEDSPLETGTNLNSNAAQKPPSTIVGSDAVEFQRAEAARLKETENILEDYISLLSANRILIANHK